MSKQPTRRSLGAFFAGAAMWIAGASTWLGDAVSARALPQTLLRAALDDPARACALGALCLAAMPPRQDAATLARAVIASVGAPAFRSRATFRRALMRKIREDFADGAIIVANGWHLSLTEARLYALAALEGNA